MHNCRYISPYIVLIGNDTVGEWTYNRINRQGKPIIQVKFPKAICQRHKANAYTQLVDRQEAHYHLRWRLKQKNLDDDLRTIRAVLEGAALTEELSTHQRMDRHWKWREQFQLILEPLCEMGLLTRSEHRHRYTVIS